ncbi:MAG: helix-turn-helix domain-containing protein [Pseudomonas sp.]|uniref:GlxA family transcriptional regulator n=1 Tax=Pseudomonas sp. TaxID=306 RepID=UPI0033966C6A
MDIINSFSAKAGCLRIGLLLYPGCMPAGLLAFADLLQAANRRAGRTLFDLHYVALQVGAVECAHGVSLLAGESLAHARLDAVLLPGFWAESLQQVKDCLLAETPLVRALAALPRRCQLWSYCTGVVLLAASGRLDREPATVTWWLADSLAQRFPKVLWQPEHNCRVTPRHATATGVNGYLPIAQALIERHLSQTLVRDLNRLMVLPRPARSHGAFQALHRIEQADPLLARLQGLVEQLPADGITVQVLAERLGVSARTLARKVAAETASSLAAYIRRIKLNQASERLLGTRAPVSQISAELGFSSDSNLRRMFKQLTQLTPAQYRQQFGRD